MFIHYNEKIYGVYYGPYVTIIFQFDINLGQRG